jgi:hypothetical protein
VACVRRTGLLPEDARWLLDEAVRVARTFQPPRRRDGRRGTPYHDFRRWMHWRKDPAHAATLAALRTVARRQATATLAEAACIATLTGMVSLRECGEMLWTVVGVNTPASDFLPEWRDRQGGLVRRMAEVIEREGRYEDMPLLADALEDVGCDNQEILDYLRRGFFCEGNHALDLILRPGLAVNLT